MGKSLARATFLLTPRLSPIPSISTATCSLNTLTYLPLDDAIYIHIEGLGAWADCGRVLLARLRSSIKRRWLSFRSFPRLSVANWCRCFIFICSGYKRAHATSWCHPARTENAKAYGWGILNQGGERLQIPQHRGYRQLQQFF